MKFLQKLKCSLRGHDWSEYTKTDDMRFLSDYITGHDPFLSSCIRCGKERVHIQHWTITEIGGHP